MDSNEDIEEKKVSSLNNQNADIPMSKKQKKKLEKRQKLLEIKKTKREREKIKRKLRKLQEKELGKLI